MMKHYYSEEILLVKLIHAYLMALLYWHKINVVGP